MNDFKSSTHKGLNISASQQLNDSTSSDVAVRVEHVSKKYCKLLRRSMFYGMQDIMRNSIGLSARSEKLRKDEFWALDGVSFDLKKGETLGIIGPNGSGKTTLLKMINGIFWPDRGKITVKGRVGALIEVGAGFHPLLSGRDNIYVNAAILGMNKREVDKKFDAIVDFADIGDFLDTPVKYYSSGMFVRLGFAVAVHCEPDILLVDEVLAVGDLAFRVKCYNKIVEITKNCAVVIVSHNMSTLSRIASKSIVLYNGKMSFNGSTAKAIQHYFSIFKKEKTIVNSDGVSLINCDIKARIENEYYILPIGMPLEMEIKLCSKHNIDSITLILTFVNASGEFVAEWNSWVNNKNLKICKGKQNFHVLIGRLLLNAGTYSMSLVVTSENMMEHLLVVYQGWTLRIIGERFGNAPYQINGDITMDVSDENCPL